ncbi:MAG TPA: hypothetical protein VNM92_09380, partial [Thermoanaerobaculia bacterium]|nr:hypothetical protein [Thermoanaerobaculia bacterium]
SNHRIAAHPTGPCLGRQSDKPTRTSHGDFTNFSNYLVAKWHHLRGASPSRVSSPLHQRSTLLSCSG